MAESLNGRGADVLQLFFLLQPAVQPTDGRNLGKRLLSLRFRVRIQDSRLVPFYYFPRFFSYATVRKCTYRAISDKNAAVCGFSFLGFSLYNS